MGCPLFFRCKNTKIKQLLLLELNMYINKATKQQNAKKKKIHEIKGCLIFIRLANS